MTDELVSIFNQVKNFLKKYEVKLVKNMMINVMNYGQVRNWLLKEEKKFFLLV